MTCNIGLMDVCQRCHNSSSLSEDEKKHLNESMEENKELLQRLS